MTGAESDEQTLQEGDSVTVRTEGTVLEKFPDGDFLVQVDGKEILVGPREVQAVEDQ